MSKTLSRTDPTARNLRKTRVSAKENVDKAAFSVAWAGLTFLMRMSIGKKSVTLNGVTMERQDTDLAAFKFREMLGGGNSIGGVSMKRFKIVNFGHSESLKENAQDNSSRAMPRELKEVVDRITEWAGGEAEALSWCRSYPIGAFGGRTAEQLVKSGRAEAVRDYLDHIALGGYA